MSYWLELAQRRFPAEKYDRHRLEATCGPTEGLATVDDLAAFRTCAPELAVELTELLRHERHRHFVKLVIFATESVPDPLFSEVVRAGVHTLNPSFNKHFIWPCTIVHGRRRVMTELLRTCRQGSNFEKAGAMQALYWGSMARENICWPHHQNYTPYEGEPDAPIEDLQSELREWAVAELIRNDDVEVRRALAPWVET